LYTGGQTDITMGLGFASFNFTNGKLSTFNKNNSWIENLGYGLGAMVNLRDINNLINKTSAILYTDNSDFISHSAIVDTDDNILLSFGPDDNKTPTSNLGYATYFRKSTSDFRYLKSLPVEVTVNKYAIKTVRALGKLLPFQGLTTNCVNMASLAL